MAKKKLVAEQQTPKVISIKMDATFFFERAVRSLDRLHYDKALKYFRRAVDYEPDNPVNHCNLAGILSEMGNYDESNKILQKILDIVDPTMTECYFYMANNYANMEDFESAEKAIVNYLEQDENGQFLGESEEMIELLSYELERPTPITSIKSREGMFEHDKARGLLEEGRFAEAVRILQRLTKKHPDFMAARNNLALAYYYMGQFEKAMDAIRQVIEAEPGNIHALCNLAIFHQHSGDAEKLAGLVALLRKTIPFHPDHLFKLATTMGILGEHETAYRLFKRLLKSGESSDDPCLTHYAAVSAFNTGRHLEARKFWMQTERLDPKSDIPRFYLSRLDCALEPDEEPLRLNYHYHLPFEEQFRLMEKSKEKLPDYLKRDPLVRASFFWALRHGDHDTKLQVIQAFSIIADSEVETSLKELLVNPDEDGYLKRVAFFVLRSMGVKEPLNVSLDGKTTLVSSPQLAVNLPVWKVEWQSVLELSLQQMQRRYSMVQQHDLETLWVEYLTRTYPATPNLRKTAGWSAALEYLTAKMHRRAISYDEVARRYAISAATVSKNVKLIDVACGLKEKMNAIFPKYSSLVKQDED